MQNLLLSSREISLATLKPLPKPLCCRAETVKDTRPSWPDVQVISASRESLVKCRLLRRTDGHSGRPGFLLEL